MVDTIETGHSEHADDGDIPPGWSYNPAKWSQRIPIVLMAFIGGVAAFYLTLFQWNVVRSIWEPFFSGGPGYANGSAKILKSPTSEIFPWPITDGFLGFLGYVGDAVFGLVGGTRRWRTMPWVVIAFGVMVGPLGAVSIGLVITQPLAYDTFCTLCVFTAIISVLMIGPAMDEMLASLQYMKRVKEHGRPFWRYFWGRGEQEPLPELEEKAARFQTDSRDERTTRRNRIAVAAQIIAALIGAYLVTAPAVWGYDGSAASRVDRFIGPLIASFATIAAFECTRGVRWLNLPLAVALALLAISPWPWDYPRDGMISASIWAAAVGMLTLVPYPQTGSYGGGWSRLWRTPKARTAR